MRFLPARFASFALLFAGAASVCADGPEAPLAREVWIHDVGDLTFWRECFLGEGGPFRPYDSVNDKERPLFGGESIEVVQPYENVDDVIEDLKSEVGGRDGEGVAAEATGTRTIEVRGPRALQERVAAAIERRRAAVMPSLSVDVAFLAGDPAACSRPGGLAAAVADRGARLLGAARLVGLVGNISSTFVGRERTFVEDHDVEVASGAATDDPIASVLPEGARIRARVQAIAPEPLLEVEAWTARHEDVRRVRTGRGEPMDFPTIDAATVQALVRVPRGRWTPVPMSRGRFLALRTVVEAPPRSNASGPLAAVLPPGSPVGPMSRATFDLHDLAARAPSFRGRDVRLWPSNFTPPEPPELPEPNPAYEPDAVLDLAKGLDPDGWAREGALLAVAHETLEVRHDEAHRKAVASLLDALRSRYLGTLRLSATVVRLPLASFPEFLAGGVEGDASTLSARPGAEILDRVVARIPRSGGRRAGWQGRDRRYLADYDVEISLRATIGNPIVNSVLEGVVLDADAVPASNGAGIACQLRFDRSTWDGVRTVPTEHGPIECPDLGLLRVRGALVIPVGATRLVGVGIEGDVATLVLLTANVGE